MELLLMSTKDHLENDFEKTLFIELHTETIMKYDDSLFKDERIDLMER